MYRKLFVPIDGSEVTPRAITASIELAQQLDAALVGFMAVPQPPLPGIGNLLDEYERTEQSHLARTDAFARDWLQRFEVEAAQSSVSFTGLHVQSGDIDQTIADHAQDTGCDMIVMATRGRGPLGEWLFGSHSKAVLSKTALPVLIVR